MKYPEELVGVAFYVTAILAGLIVVGYLLLSSVSVFSLDSIVGAALNSVVGR